MWIGIKTTRLSTTKTTNSNLEGKERLKQLTIQFNLSSVLKRNSKCLHVCSNYIRVRKNRVEKERTIWICKREKRWIDRMSGDTQPRKRNKDKKRRRGNEQCFILFHSFLAVACVHKSFQIFTIDMAILLWIDLWTWNPVRIDTQLLFWFVFSFNSNVNELHCFFPSTDYPA